MDEEFVAVIVIFALSGYAYFSMNRKDKERGLDNMDISYARFKIKVIMATVVFVSFFVLVFKIYRYTKHSNFF